MIGIVLILSGDALRPSINSSFTLPINAFAASCPPSRPRVRYSSRNYEGLASVLISKLRYFLGLTYKTSLCIGIDQYKHKASLLLDVK